MKEKPILFTGEMVRAILRGQKTQTRRVIKPQPVGEDDAEALESIANGKPGWSSIKTLPYFVGDILWVKETWAKPEFASRTLYKADYDSPLFEDEDCERPVRWKPSIFMSRHHSRVTLEVRAVGVEMLHDISDKDAFWEGGCTAMDRVPASLNYPGKWIGIYQELWDRINGKRYPWASNPWVWVVEFKRL